MRQPTTTAAAPAASPALSVRVVDDLAGLRALQPEWDRIAERAPLPTARHAWVAAAATAFAGERPLQVIVVRRRGRLVAAAPLVASTGNGQQLEPLALAELDEPTDLLYEDRPALGALAEGLARARLCVSLRRLPVESPTGPALRQAYRLRGMVTATEGLDCPTLTLAGGVDPEARMGSRLRADLRRARRRAELIGTVRTEMLEVTPPEVEPRLSEALLVESRSWKGREGSALLHDPQRSAFFGDWAPRAASDGTLRFCFLRISGRPAAMQIAVEHAERLWLLKIGYDELYARCSPGALLTFETICAASRRGLRSYEFLGGREAWTSRWTTASRPSVSLRAYPARPAGMAQLGSDLSSKARRRLGLA
jgi:CelD/BcsL family acetyltransferase involved in cellulose biosynthesis